MRKTVAAITALILTMPAAALAAAVSISAGANVGVSAGADAGASGSASASGSTTASGSATTSSEGDAFLRAFVLTQAELDAIADVGETTMVNIVRIDASLAANNQTFAQAQATNASATAELQAAIEANAALRAGLEAEGIEVSSVVAADVAADGTLTLFAMS